MTNRKATKPPVAFKSADAFRRWLERNHASETELVIQLFKTSAHHLGMGYAEALDEALCFGWIDGIRRGHDEHSFTIRFTPRKPKSKWSRVNVRHFDRLKTAGRVHSAGHAAFKAGVSYKAEPYSFESAELLLAPAFRKKFQANKKAWAFFTAQPPYYRKVTTFYVMSAKREETRETRLGHLIRYSTRGERIPSLTAAKK